MVNGGGGGGGQKCSKRSSVRRRRKIREIKRGRRGIRKRSFIYR